MRNVEKRKLNVWESWTNVWNGTVAVTEEKWETHFLIQFKIGFEFSNFVKVMTS